MSLALAQQGFHGPRFVRRTCRYSWVIIPIFRSRADH
jgi:hypothetical protein